MIQDAFFDTLGRQLEQIRSTQREAIAKAGRLMADTVAHDGIIHMFGSGHSQNNGLEMFYRAGGLVPVNVIFTPCLSVYPHASWSTVFERQEGLAEQILKYEDIRPGDVAIISSVSGRNAVPLEIAQGMKERGAGVIALTSKNFSAGVTPRHSSGKFFFDFADLVIDLCCELGDASMSLPGMRARFAPTSSIVGFTILEALESQTIEYLLADGIQPPVFVSSNLDNGDSINAAYLEKYKGRVKCF